MVPWQWGQCSGTTVIKSIAELGKGCETTSVVSRWMAQQPLLSGRVVDRRAKVLIDDKGLEA